MPPSVPTTTSSSSADVVTAPSQRRPTRHARQLQDIRAHRSSLTPRYKLGAASDGHQCPGYHHAPASIAASNPPPSSPFDQPKRHSRNSNVAEGLRYRDTNAVTGRARRCMVWECFRAGPGAGSRPVRGRFRAGRKRGAGGVKHLEIRSILGTENIQCQAPPKPLMHDDAKTAGTPRPPTGKTGTSNRARRDPTTHIPHQFRYWARLAPRGPRGFGHPPRAATTRFRGQRTPRRPHTRPAALQRPRRGPCRPAARG